MLLRIGPFANTAFNGCGQVETDMGMTERRSDRWTLSYNEDLVLALFSALRHERRRYGRAIRSSVPLVAAIGVAWIASK